MKASTARRATNEGAKAVRKADDARLEALDQAREQIIAGAKKRADEVYADLEAKIQAACDKGETSLQTSLYGFWDSLLTAQTLAPILKRRLKRDGFTVGKCRVGAYDFRGSDESCLEKHYDIMVDLNWSN